MGMHRRRRVLRACATAAALVFLGGCAGLVGLNEYFAVDADAGVDAEAAVAIDSGGDEATEVPPADGGGPGDELPSEPDAGTPPSDGGSDGDAGCGAQSCAGCCNAEGLCAAGGRAEACGAGGAECLNCSASGETCSDGQCVTPPPDAGNGGGQDSGPAACVATACANLCVPYFVQCCKSD